MFIATFCSHPTNLRLWTNLRPHFWLENRVAMENDDPIGLDGLAEIVENHVSGVLCHFRILHKHRKARDRGKVRLLAG
jgi:hypothetical protein